MLPLLVLLLLLLLLFLALLPSTPLSSATTPRPALLLFHRRHRPLSTPIEPILSSPIPYHYGSWITTLLLHRQSCARTTTKQSHHDTRHRIILKSVSETITKSTMSSSKTNARIVFPGGGLFFFWQAGVVAHLQDEGYNLSSEATLLLSGASAGALSATLAKWNVCPIQATELALSLSEDAQVWERPLGLQGVWGSLIYEWLDRLLPADIEERIRMNNKDGSELHILLTSMPSFGKSRISRFESRQDLIHANLASVHLPWFLDGKFMSTFRGKPYIDGSFFARPSDYYFEYHDINKKNERRQETIIPTILVDFKRDPLMKGRAIELIQVVSKQTIWDIFERGKTYGKIMDAQGEFRFVSRY